MSAAIGDLALSTEAADALAKMVKGSRIEGWRTFPHPHHYALTKADGGGRYATELAVVTVERLVALKLVRPVVLDSATWDSLAFILTDRGRAVAAELL